MTDMTQAQTPSRRPRHDWLRHALGATAALALLLMLGEIYLRVYPPDYLQPFLGDDSPLTGHLVSDPDFGVGFPSFEELAKDNPATLGPGSLLQPDRSPGTRSTVWLVLGNSFGYELALRMKREFPEHITLNLDRRELLTVRMAQIKTLLESGCRPEHIFLVVIPNDFHYVVKHELRHHQANSRGGLVFQPRLPGGIAGALLTRSRLAFSGWTRLGQHCDHPSLKMRQLLHRVPAGLKCDQQHLFAALGKYQRKHQVPVTVILVPGMREMVRNEGFALEDAVVSVMKAEGLDYLDPRPAFLAEPSRRDLYVPDGHLSERGNMIVLQELRRQLTIPDLDAVQEEATP